MEYRLVTKPNGLYIECLPDSELLDSENRALDLVAACGEASTTNLMIHAANLTPDFYQLKTGLAGNILLKFSNYHLRVAAVLTEELVNQGRFREMALETNRGSHFRIFYNPQAAEDWLLAGG